MKKLLFDANFKKDMIGQQLTFRLINACKSIVPDCVFEGIAQYPTKEKIPENVKIYRSINMLGIDSLWYATVPALNALISKDEPFYFPMGNIPGLMPSNTPVISLVRDILPLDAIKDEDLLKKYKRKLQTDINRSDLIFVLNDNIKNRLTQEFLFLNEPVVLNFASLIPAEYLDLPMARLNEKYFFVDVENVSPTGLSELLKVFIYSQMKDRKATKLYLSGKLRVATNELLINLEVARKVGVIREYKNLTSEQRSMLLRGALAAILPTKVDVMPFAHLDAMKCSCPVVTDAMPSIMEICGDAVIYADISEAESFKVLLLRLEQDEAYRNEYIYKGLCREKNYSWDKSAQVFIESIDRLYTEE
ncbi:MAG: glycosyltransferase [bacterium]|nr:glycosyltransferase [bacterium]